MHRPNVYPHLQHMCTRADRRESNMHATPGSEVNTFEACPQVTELAQNWLRQGGSIFPESIMQGSDHVFEAFTQAVESMQNDPKYVRL